MPQKKSPTFKLMFDPETILFKIYKYRQKVSQDDWYFQAVKEPDDNDIYRFDYECLDHNLSELDSLIKFVDQYFYVSDSYGSLIWFYNTLLENKYDKEIFNRTVNDLKGRDNIHSLRWGVLRAVLEAGYVYNTEYYSDGTVMSYLIWEK